MQLLLANTKLEEVIHFFTHKGLKAQGVFGEMGKRKANLRKSLEALSAKEPFDCYTGKGILSIYENDLKSAISHLKYAYNLTNHSINASMNYANALMLNEDHKLAIEVYISAITKAQNDKRVFSDIFKTLCPFGYLQEIEQLLKIASTIELSHDQERQLNIARRTVEFLHEINVPIDIFRLYRTTMDTVFYKYFTFTSESREETQCDLSRMVFSTTIYLPLDESNEEAESILGKMNDDFQDIILKKRREYYSENLSEFRKASARLNYYFGFDYGYHKEDQQVA
jgi:tetratricopeptide (TPR) repeat protein